MARIKSSESFVSSSVTSQVEELALAAREELIALVLEQREVIAGLEKRVALLEQQLGLGGDPPAKPPFVRASVVRKQKKERKKREGQFCRRRENPTETVDHASSSCPDCGRGLAGGSVHRTRQVIEINPTPVQVTEHVIWRRYCGVCKRQVEPKVDLSGQVLGKRRIGLNLTSWIAALHIDARIPIRTIQRLLTSLFQVHISTGEIVDLLDAVARKAEPVASGLLEEVRRSPYVHADETGWRENGQSGYLWSLSTPNVRYFRCNKSRAGAVAQDLIGQEFGKVLVSDFYCAYNRLPCLHQRCWVHFARDLHKLREGADALVNAWVDSVLDVWQRAKAYQTRCRSGGYLDLGLFARRRYRKSFEQELYALAEPVIQDQSAPHRTLAGRIGLFLSELFTFVEYPDVHSDNNPAERAIRPAVIARKVRGGTRSAKGSATWDTLMTVFATWKLRNLEPAEQCRVMLQQPT